MIVGVLSDTHGHADMAAAAVRVLRAHGAEYLIHCGDVGDDADGQAVLDAMAGTPGAFVFGNNDFDRADLARYGEGLGLRCLNEGGTIDLDGRRIAVTHGDVARTVARFTDPAAGVDFLFTGHSHLRHDRRAGRVRWINPGALFRASVKTVAVLDVTTGVMQSIEVDAAS